MNLCSDAYSAFVVCFAEAQLPGQALKIVAGQQMYGGLQHVSRFWMNFSIVSDRNVQVLLPAFDLFLTLLIEASPCNAYTVTMILPAGAWHAVTARDCDCHERMHNRTADQGVTPVKPKGEPCEDPLPRDCSSFAVSAGF